MNTDTNPPKSTHSIPIKMEYARLSLYEQANKTLKIFAMIFSITYGNART